MGAARAELPRPAKLSGNGDWTHFARSSPLPAASTMSVRNPISTTVERLDSIIGGQPDCWHTFILLGIRTIAIELLAGRCLDAGSEPIEMLESSGEVSNVEWIKLGESLITDKDADGLNRDGPFDGHPKPDCPQLAVSYGFASPLVNVAAWCPTLNGETQINVAIVRAFPRNGTNGAD